MKRSLAGLMLAAALIGAGAQAQSARIDLAQTAPKPAAPATRPAANATPAASPPAPNVPMTLMLRGLDKITGRPTDITAPIGKPVKFATLTITVRYCYSTPPSEPPETSAFVQIEDHRPDQPARRVFSGWMYASSPGLNGMEHPLYDVWVISCRGGSVPAAATAAAEPAKVTAPDASDKEKMPEVPLR